VTAQPNSPVQIRTSRLSSKSDIIDRCQNHVIHTGKNRVRRHYQLYDYADEKQAAWAKLGDYLERLLSGAVAPAELQKRLTAKQLLAA